METRLLILNADPVFQDRTLALLDAVEGLQTRIVRSMPDAISVLLAENFDGFMVEGEAALALEQATSARQHFPSLSIICVTPPARTHLFAETVGQQNILTITTGRSTLRLRSQLR